MSSVFSLSAFCRVSLPSRSHVRHVHKTTVNFHWVQKAFSAGIIHLLSESAAEWGIVRSEMDSWEPGKIISAAVGWINPHCKRTCYYTGFLSADMSIYATRLSHFFHTDLVHIRSLYWLIVVSIESYRGLLEQAPPGVLNSCELSLNVTQTLTKWRVLYK